MYGSAERLVCRLSRISLALAIARLFPPKTRYRSFAIAMAICFAVAWIGLLIQSAVLCSYDVMRNQCHGTSWISAVISESTSMVLLMTLTLYIFLVDLGADSVLAATPLWTLWSVNLPTNPRRLILSSFVASFVCFIMGVIALVFLLGPDSWGAGKITLFFTISELQVKLCIILFAAAPHKISSVRALSSNLQSFSGCHGVLPCLP